jgi:hypothetical protein
MLKNYFNTVTRKDNYEPVLDPAGIEAQIIYIFTQKKKFLEFDSYTGWGGRYILKNFWYCDFFTP